MFDSIISFWKGILCNPIEEGIITIEPGLFSGHQQKLCNLESDGNQEFYLKPIKQLSSSYALPSNEEWPAKAKTAEEFWKKIEEYPGGLSIRPNFLANLLNDVSINIPNENVWLFQHKTKVMLSKEAVKDLDRKSIIQINKKEIDLKKNLKKDLTNENRAHDVFLQCLDLLNGNIKLTANLLKLSTQATMGLLGSLMIWRFNNLELGLHANCMHQAFIVKKKKSNLIKIFYSTIWSVGDSNTHKFLKANVEMLILEEHLVKGSAGLHSLTVEKCSKFFDTFAEALNEDLSCLAYPSSAKSYDEYLFLIEFHENKVEKFHPYQIREFLCHAGTRSNYLISSKESIIFPIFRNLILKHGQKEYLFNEKNEKKIIEFIYENIFISFHNSTLKNKILFFTLNLLKYIIKNYNKKYNNLLFDTFNKIDENKFSFAFIDKKIYIYCQNRSTLLKRDLLINTEVCGTLEDFENNLYQNIQITQTMVLDEQSAM